MKKLLLLACIFSSAFAFDQRPTLEGALERKVVVNNNIVTKVNGKTISMLDIAKKLDYMSYQNNPEVLNSDAAKYQFYLSAWRYALIDMINNELMLAEAASKDVKVPDSEIREVIQTRFGPNITQSLEKLNLTYKEIFEIVKTEEIVKRIRWFFVNTKALQTVTPQMIRAEYERSISNNPAGDRFHFQIITIKAPNEVQSSSLALKTYQLLKNKTDSTPDDLKQEKDLPAEQIQISTEYTTSETELSDIYKEALSSLEPGEYSTPSSQISRLDGKMNWRIFYLKQKERITPPSFQEMNEKIKDELLQKVVKEESTKYFERLYKKYSVDEIALQKLLSDERATPFFLR